MQFGHVKGCVLVQVCACVLQCTTCQHVPFDGRNDNETLSLPLTVVCSL